MKDEGLTYMKEQKYVFEAGNKPIPCEMYIEMSVFSEEEKLNLSELTQILQIKPTATWHKGDMIRDNLYRKETCWEMQTPRMQTSSFEEVFQSFMSILDGKVKTLAKYAKRNSLSVKIYLVIMVVNNMPSIIITKEIAEFLTLLDATIEFDMYFK
ncbi:DUF4279 domain-containing protein [Bacteroides sp. 214]|uniref:DUF4279 domain-containing protein n=1 Tax=Bacteroides sp. 214 TaxID=2302935 RepID=UPI0013D25057|nr:DUF4279 domain-containing protein [Bacteroides sp. 214]